MSNILDCFIPEQVEVTIVRKDGDFDQSTGRQEEAEKSFTPVKCVLYNTGQSEGILGEKIREDVDGTAVFYAGTDIRVKDEIHYQGLVYNIQFNDNVAFQNEIIVCSLSLKA